MKKIDWSPAPDVKKRLARLFKEVNLDWLATSRIYCFRSRGAKTRAMARIWGLSRIWQKALKVKPAYIVEVISEKYDRLKEEEKDKIILHEVNHIPKNFSGALMPHVRRGKRSFHGRLRGLYEDYHRSRR